MWGALTGKHIQLWEHMQFQEEGIRDVKVLHTNSVERFGLVMLCLHHEEAVPNKLNLIQGCRVRTRIQALLAPSLRVLPLCSLQFLVSDN